MFIPLLRSWAIYNHSWDVTLSNLLLSILANGRILTAVDVMRDLLRRSGQLEDFIPRAELEIREDEIILLDTSDGVKQEVWAYLTASVMEPVAFVNKTASSTFSRVVVFTVAGVQGVYDKYSLMFAVQVITTWCIYLLLTATHASHMSMASSMTSYL